MKLNLKEITILLFLYVLLYPGCGENNEREKEEHSDKQHPDVITLSEESIKQIGLETEIVSYKPFTGYLNIPAKVITNQDYEAQVGSLVQGRVNKVFVNVGNYVKAGDDLMYVEGLEIGEIKAGYLTAKASLDFQKANYERQKTLTEQNVGSQRSFLEAQAEYQKALAEFNAQDKKIHSIGLEDEDVSDDGGSDEHTPGTLSVKAPISGMVVERNVVIGQLVDGTTNAFRIINTSSVWVDGQIYDKDLNKLTKNMDVVFTTASYPGEKFNGKVIYIGQTINENSRTITVRAEFKNEKGKLKPQMYGDLLMPAGENSKAILLPAESIIKVDNEDCVFVQNKDKTFIKRVVVVGAVMDEIVEIREGLKAQEKVVTRGAFYLKSESMKDELEEHED